MKFYFFSVVSVFLLSIGTGCKKDKVNIAPVANAGLSQIVQIPTDFATLSGSGKDEDGTIVSYTWSLLSGPNNPVIQAVSSPSTKVTGLIAGSYSFQLTVTDDKGSKAADSVSVIVLKETNKTPVADAGASQAITLPVDFVTLTGVGTDTDGRISAYLWSQISGPAATVISNPGSASTLISGFKEGKYVFQLMVIDNAGATGVDTASVTVTAPVIQTITLQSGTTADFNNVSVNGATDVSVSGGDINAGAWTSGGIPLNNRGHFKFNLSQVPVGAKILSAKLSLYSMPAADLTNGDRISANSGVNNSMYIRRITSDWSGTTITWFSQPSNTATDQLSVPHTSQSFLDLVDLDVTAMVSSMVSENKRYGFMIMLQNETYYNIRQFCSPGYSNAAKRPKLVITFQ